MELIDKAVQGFDWRHEIAREYTERKTSFAHYVFVNIYSSVVRCLFTSTHIYTMLYGSLSVALHSTSNPSFPSRSSAGTFSHS